ncbi:MAG: cation:proton antiporter [Campylobacterota bacterium]|nr:cation:proton antiporter [Campylobacterota bacterium]
MVIDNLFWIGLLLVVGYVAGIVSERFRLPKVTGYILIGIVLSPSVTHILPESFLCETETIVHFALSMIAFMIGGSLKYEKIKKLEKTILSMMLSESETAFALVALGLFFCLPFIALDYLASESWKEYLLMALFLGAISAATAPAAVLAVMHEYRAKGPLTTTLLGIVATDDAIALINFSLVLSVAALIQGGDGNNHFLTLLEPLFTIFFSLVFGITAGWLQARHINTITKEGSLIISTIGVLLIIYASAEHFALDGLLVCMAYGVILVNKTKKSDEVFQVIQEHFEEIIFVFFFILSGASVELKVLAEVWPIALLYVLLRIIGKMLGSWFGARISNAEPMIKKYTGMALMPQAGVAIGLALMLYHNPDFSKIGPLVLNTVIAATAINEIVGPFLLKIALFKAGEAKEPK